MVVVHVAVTTSDDYLVRREPYRAAHIERLVALRNAGSVVGGGPAPDGRAAELFYRLTRPDELGRLVEEDPYYVAGAWAGYTPRSFTSFVEPWEPVPVVLDGSRRLTIVEGPAAEPEMAEFALIELRGGGRLAFGGSLDGAGTLAVVRSPESAEAAGWLAQTGCWAADRLTTRPFLYVL
jgi:uncharacterized protein YciI